MTLRWTPHLTVAAIIERDGRFLMVEESPDSRGKVLNQPAGHVEEDEGLIDAVTREVLEETQHHFNATAITGIYRWRDPNSQITYLRVVFCGAATPAAPHYVRDPDIIACHWYSHSELLSSLRELRSPMVLKAVDDYLAGQRLPLTLIHEIA